MQTYTINELNTMNQKEVVYKFSKNSIENLLNIDRRLVDIIFDVANHIDMKIVYGYRTPEEQNRLFKAGKSSKDGYSRKSEHQSGMAVDILPLPKNVNMYDGKDRDNDTRWSYFVGFFQATALKLGHKTRVGWKWRIDPMDVMARPIRENTLVDMNHIELSLT